MRRASASPKRRTPRTRPPGRCPRKFGDKPCGRPLDCRGRCRTHYIRYLEGDRGAQLDRPQGGTIYRYADNPACAVQGCELPAERNDMCSNHARKKLQVERMLKRRGVAVDEKTMRARLAAGLNARHFPAGTVHWRGTAKSTQPAMRHRCAIGVRVGRGPGRSSETVLRNLSATAHRALIARIHGPGSTRMRLLGRGGKMMLVNARVDFRLVEDARDRQGEAIRKRDAKMLRWIADGGTSVYLGRPCPLGDTQPGEQIRCGYAWRRLCGRRQTLPEGD